MQLAVDDGCSVHLLEVELSPLNSHFGLIWGLAVTLNTGATDTMEMKNSHPGHFDSFCVQEGSLLFN